MRRIIDVIGRFMRSALLSILFSVTLAVAFSNRGAAQDLSWVQIEANRSLTTSQDRARSFAGDLQNVTGFYVGSGWYAIALGPYSREDALTLLSDLKRAGLVPTDSFVSDGRSYRNQYWPIGTGAETTPQPLPDTLELLDEATAAEQELLEALNEEPDAADPIVDETVDANEAEPEPVADDPTEGTQDQQTPPASESDAPEAEADTPTEEATPETEPTRDPTPATTEPEPEPEPEPEFRDPGETVKEARASEAALTRDEKRALQVALNWAGFYESAIDGLYGKGTRRSMAKWQKANGYEATGIMTTSQRQELYKAYNAILDGMDLQTVQDDASGVRMKVPTGVVAFSRYTPPFVRFDASTDLPVQVLMISQSGNETTLAGLYEVMSTLEIVPPEGDRARDAKSFTLTGADDTRHSYTEARLVDGQIKGFTLVWPAGDEQRRKRVLEHMKDSFERIEGVLDPNIVTPDQEQAVDLVSGLKIRKPKTTGTGFFVDQRGTVLTSLDTVNECTEVTLNGGSEAKISHQNPELGLAVVTPNAPLAPLAVAQFQAATPRLQSQVALAGFPYGGILTSAATNFGTLADIRGLDGDDSLLRLALNAQPTEIGGPVFDNTGHVLGMLVPAKTDKGRVLPKDVAFALNAPTIVQALAKAGISATSSEGIAFSGPETVTDLSAKMAILVSCWD